MSANIEAMVREGINAAKAGRKDEARALLTKAVEIDSYNADAWLWLSGVVEAEDDQRTCLENVLAIDPTNTRARQGLDYIVKKSSPVSETAAPPPPASPAPPAPPASSAAFSASSVTSVEWDYGAVETSSPSATRPVNEPSPQDYDDWVSGLNLGTQAEDSPTAEDQVAAFGSASPFVGFDDEFFDSGPFEEVQNFAVPVESEPSERPVAAPTTAIAYRPPPTFDDVPAAAVAVSAVTPPAAPARSPSKVSPGRDDGMVTNYSDYGVLDNVIDVEVGTEEVPEIFPNIPKAIQPTRLPGTKEGAPAGLVILALILFILNFGASVFVVMKLLTPA
jgi:hypothetical protein